MSNHSVIEHRANYYYARMEEDFLAICSEGKSSPHCKALILSILENWTNTKRDKNESEYIYLTLPQWTKFTYMLYERNIITECIHELLDDKLIERRPIKMFDQNTFEYRLCCKAVQDLIRQLPEKDAKETFPRLDAYIVYRDKAKAEAKVKREEKKLVEGVGEKSHTPSHDVQVREKSTGVREKSPTGYVKSQRNKESITKITKESTKENTENASSDAPPHASLSDTHSQSTEENNPTAQEVIPSGVPAITPQSSPAPLTVQEASVNGTLPKIEAESQIGASPIALETTQPTRRGKKPDLSPVLPPARPDTAMEWGVEKCLAWGDYVRQSTLRPSTRSNSNYDKALQAARRIVGRGITENMFLIIWLNWMKGLGMDLQPLPEPALMSETWPNYSTDLWICDEHFEAEAAKYKRKKAERETQAGERKTEQQATVQIAAGVVQTVTYQESPLERHNRELREKFMGAGRKVG